MKVVGLVRLQPMLPCRHGVDRCNQFTIMENRVEVFTARESLSLENSFMTIKEQQDIRLVVTIGIHDDGGSGWFEFYDDESGGEEWYAEGGIELDGLSVTGYDGVFALPMCIIEKLQEMGFDTTEIE